MKLDCSKLNALFEIDGKDIISIDSDCFEPMSTPTFVGEKHPLWGTHRTEEQKQKQSKVITDWWKNVLDDERESMKNNLSSAIKSQWDLLTPEERKVSRKWKINPRKGKDNPMYGKQSASKGKIWITNGETNKMVKPNEIPEGWYKGRVNVISNEGKKRLKNLTSERNRKGELGHTAKNNKRP